MGDITNNFTIFINVEVHNPDSEKCLLLPKSKEAEEVLTVDKDK